MIIDGKKTAAIIQQELKEQINLLIGRKPSLAVILVGDHPPSQIYISRKTQACQAVGISSIKRLFPKEISEQHLLQEIALLNEDPLIDGILVQLPLPSHIDPVKVTHAISPEKDVDGFHPTNLGKLLMGDSRGFIPCTPLGIKELLEHAAIQVEGQHVVVMGRSNLVGKPMGVMMMQKWPGANATVTLLHSQSKNMKTLCLLADILIVAIGQPKFLTADMVKEGVVVVDVGINKVSNPDQPRGYQIVGDVDFENVHQKCSFITPVPGGVGPMTIAMLLSNTLKSYKNRTDNRWVN